MKALVVGVGAVGARAARQLLSSDGVEQVLLCDPGGDHVDDVASSLGPRVRVVDAPDAEAADVAVLALPAGMHRAEAERQLERGTHVVSVSDAMRDVRSLVDLDAEARERRRLVVVGAGFSPGLTCVLARHAAGSLEAVDEVHVAKVGTAGPACARQHHDALGGRALDWRDGRWVERRGGSGRELCWFPDPVGAEDCYRAALPDALLLVPAFPGVARVTARVAANRRDRLTARLPMLRPPHPEGRVGAVRVEVRGRRGRGRDALVLGAMDRPATAAAAVGALAAVWAVEGRLLAAGAGGLATLVDPLPFLAELARRGVKAATFEGAGV
jgi:hypothetical protein